MQIRATLSQFKNLCIVEFDCSLTGLDLVCGGEILANCYRCLVRTISHGHPVTVDEVATVILLRTEDGPFVLSIGLESKVIIVGN